MKPWPLQPPGAGPAVRLGMLRTGCPTLCQPGEGALPATGRQAAQSKRVQAGITCRTVRSNPSQLEGGKRCLRRAAREQLPARWFSAMLQSSVKEEGKNK